MIINSQRTIYALDMQSHMMLGMPYETLPNTTLNEKYNFLTNLTTGGAYPTIKYLVIGKGGTPKFTDSLIKHSTHTAKDAALFEQVPFVMKTHETDLSVTEQANYRFRFIEIHNGIEYVCYYLKVIPSIDLSRGIYQVNVVDSEGKLGYFDTNRSDILSPVPAVNINYLDTANSVYLAKSMKVMFEMTADDIANLKEVYKILYNQPINLTEIGVCSGIDTPTASGRIEAKSVQVNYFVGVDINLVEDLDANGRFIRSIEIGGSEMLIM